MQITPETNETERPKIPQEELEQKFREDITKSFKTIMQSLERLGVVQKYTGPSLRQFYYRFSDGSSYESYDNTGNQSLVDLNDLPNPFKTLLLTKTRVFPTPTRVIIEMKSPDDFGHNSLKITWKSSIHEEQLTMIPGWFCYLSPNSNKVYGGLPAFLSWKLTGEDSDGEQVNEEKYFGRAGKNVKFGKSKNQFSKRDIEADAVNLGILTDALEKKARMVPHPNQLPDYLADKL